MKLVTGGLGFIGSALIKELNDQGHEDVIIVDKFRDKTKWMNVRDLRFTTFVPSDELFSEQGKRLLNKVTKIYHMGACSSTTEMDMDFLYKNNVEFSMRLYDWANQSGSKFCYASSAATYGDGEDGYSDDHQGIPKLKPMNPYGYSKQLFDEWVIKHSTKPKSWFGIKFFNVYGPNEYHKGSMKSVAHQAHCQIKASGTVKLFKSHRSGYKDGEQKRDFVYVKDVCRAMIELMHLPDGEFSGIYNMGTGKARTFKDLVKAVFTANKRTENIEYIDMPEHLRDQYQYFTQAEIGKLSQALPNFKFHSVEDGIKDYVENHLHKKSPYLNSK